VVTSPITSSGGVDAHYDFKYLSGTLTVTRGQLVVHADHLQRSYGQTNPPLTGYVCCPPDSVGIVLSLTTTATTNSPLGDYPILASVTAPENRLTNYLVTIENNTLSVLNGYTYRELHSFGYTTNTASTPGGLIVGGDGSLYGWTGSATTTNSSAIFKISTNGTGYTEIHAFRSANDGTLPDALVAGPDGWLYGSTYQGGISNAGTIFKIGRNGENYQILHTFTGQGDGGGPLVAYGTNGILYVATSSGGAGHLGTLCQMDTNGAGFSALHDFLGGGLDGYSVAGLTFGSDGILYGTTFYGGASGYGALFTWSPQTASYQVVKSFSTSEGEPGGPLLEGPGHEFYGLTENGGQFFAGSLYRVDSGGVGFAVLTNLDNIPYGNLVWGSDGSLFCDANYDGIGYGSVFRVSTNGGGFKTVFAYPDGDGSGMASDGNGLLYLATYNGGIGSGSIIRIDEGGANSAVLHAFSLAGGDAFIPGILIAGSDGYLYGTAASGGSSNGGAIFRVDQASGTTTLVHEFSNASGEIHSPGSLIEGADGILYGTSDFGGSSNAGSIYRLNRDGTDFTILHDFTIGDGWEPLSLIEGNDGKLYGLTDAGGAASVGTLFALDTDGENFTVVRSFGVPDGDGSHPKQLIEGRDGNLYGITLDGGAHGVVYSGTLFKTRKDGSQYSILHSFQYNAFTTTDGSIPEGLTQETDGRIYGVTRQGGLYSNGTIFSVETNGANYRIIQTFFNDAGYHFSGLVEGPDGTLYGTTSTGAGSVYKINKDGSGYAVLYSPTSPTTWPYGVESLVLDANGVIFGLGSGSQSLGGVFSLNPIMDVTPPQLSIIPGAGTVTILWSPATPGFVLQQNDTLNLPTWTSAPSGATNPVTLPAGMAQRWFRVRKP
jgi:uncharacterized repeat protein (TIGR03803 family)